ncbi:HD-domain/PDEase-like protein, partial [Agrocybe pediades]
MCRALSLDVPQGIANKPPSIPGHAYPRDWRRRSADIGGLQLAMATNNNTTALGAQGQGWMGGEAGEVETLYAELLSDMYTQTISSVKDNSLTSTPPSTPEHVRSRLIRDLGRWNFEPHNLNEDEVTSCTLILFEVLFRIEGMHEAIPISMEQITSFVHHLRRIYRYENTYHNFEHALDVLQATQSYLKSAGIVPPPSFLLEPPGRTWVAPKSVNDGSLLATLGHRELFMLYVAAIGHDVGHPGFTNNFMKNAKTPLSMIFDHTSALEKMHCQLLLRVMRHHGFGVLLDDAQHGNHMKKVLVQSVLATDMGIHNDFMLKLKGVVEGEIGSLCMRQIVLCQAILKNADISNPSRPFLVSKHWASMLMQEWTAQANLEEEFQLQPTVMSSSDPLKEASSQIFFIQTFVKPLLELTERAMPSMAMYVGHCKNNLKTWK